MSKLTETALKLETLGHAVNDHACSNTRTGELLIEAAKMLIAADGVDVEGQIDVENARWQDGIAKYLADLSGCDHLDGGGCDSGDPLDFTLAVICQAFAYLDEQRTNCKQVARDR